MLKLVFKKIYICVDDYESKKEKPSDKSFSKTLDDIIASSSSKKVMLYTKKIEKY